MKKLGIVLGLALLGATTLLADFQLTLIDKDGVETKQCIKSYSFSNNLESLAKKNAVGLKDVYSSTEEILTNKVWDGKPVYRRVFDDIGLYSKETSWNTWRHIYFKNLDSNFNVQNNDYIEKLVNAEVSFDGTHEHYSIYEYKSVQFRYDIDKNGLHYTSTYHTNSSKATVVIEYTKTTDEANSPSNSFKSYLHYVPSSSTTNEVTTVDLEDKGVKFLKNYTYAVDTDSCIAN